MLKSLFRAIAVIAVLAATAPAVQAASDKTPMEQKLEEGARALLEAMRMLLEAIPRYGPPEVQPNGDILIPRRDGLPLPPKDMTKPPADEDPDTKRL